MESTIFSVRMEKKLKNSFDKLCEDFGMSMSTAFTLFAKAVVREKKIPFTIMSSKSKASAEDFTKAKNMLKISPRQKIIFMQFVVITRKKVVKN